METKVFGQRPELWQYLRSLRGFDENGFYMNQYHIAGFEVYFEFGKDDYFYLFNDDALVWTEFQITLKRITR